MEAPDSSRVLVVEDDPGVLGVTVRMLAAGGFDCERATCGSEALLLLSHAPDRFAAAVVDLGLPDVDGDALLDRVAELAPHVPVLATSGRPREVPPRAATFLQKPFTLQRLLAAVRGLAAAHAAVGACAAT